MRLAAHVFDGMLWVEVRPECEKLWVTLASVLSPEDTSLVSVT